MRHDRSLPCKLFTKTAKLPVRAHPTDAGADLYADESLVLGPNSSALIGTGIGIKIDEGWGGFIDPRSSMRIKNISCEGTAIIDSAYRGEIKVFLTNRGTEPFPIVAGETRIGQLTIVPTMLCNFHDAWNDTERGTGGFGSTG